MQDAFFGLDGTKRRTVGFKVRDRGFSRTKRIVFVVINQLTWEDGSSESWIFEGYTVGTGLVGNTGSSKVRGWFRTSDRKGCMETEGNENLRRRDPSGFKAVIDKHAR